MFFSVVGPGYPSIPSYCAHEYSLPYHQYDDHTLGPEDCVKKCASKGHFSSAGLHGPSCVCGARLPARENAVEESNCNNDCEGRGPDHGCGGNVMNSGIVYTSVYKVNKTADAEYVAAPELGLDWQLDSCVSRYTFPDYLDTDWDNNTPRLCLDKCRDRNYTYAGVKKYGCFCGHASPEFARVHPSQCSWSCPGDRNQTCGADKFFSVVGPGYPSIPPYCAHAESLPYIQYTSESLGPKHCMKTCAFGHPDAVYTTGGYQYASRAAGPFTAPCSCGSLAPPSYLVVDKSKCDKPCIWLGPEEVARHWRTKDILAPEFLAEEVEYFDPRRNGIEDWIEETYWYRGSEEYHEADTEEWLCGGSFEGESFRSVYKLTLTAPVDESEEDCGMEVSSMEDSSVEG